MESGFEFNLYETLFKNCFIQCSSYTNGNLQLSLYGLDPNVSQITHFADITLEQDTVKLKEYEIVVDNRFKPTLITGGNAKGKTTILYAIVWAFLGANLTGDERVWLGNKKCDGCYVELHFIDNIGNNHILIRYKNRYDSKINFIMLDNKKIEQKGLQTFYKDKKLFLSILNLNYFLYKKTTEQKELIDNYLPEIDIKEVYKKLSDYEKNLLEGCPTNMSQYIQELNDNKKMYENQIKTIQGKIDYAQTIIDSTPLGEMLNFEKEEELNLDRQHLSYLTTDKNTATRVKQEKIVLMHIVLYVSKN